jgi:hypothetical protein
VLVTATYIEGGVTQTAQETVTIVDSSSTLMALSISGANSLNEGTASTYTATATYSNGTTKTVAAGWSENSSYAKINSSGILTAAQVTEDETVTVTANFTAVGVTKTVRKKVTIVDIPLVNIAPAKPTIVSPYDGQAGCEVVFDIITEAFSDTNGDAHAQSQWQISKQSDFNTPVLDVLSSGHLTQLPIPHSVLDKNTTYYVRVRFYDVYLTASAWSDTVQLETTAETNDTNDDGVPDDQEVGVGVDLDGNGVHDVDEPENIVSVQTTDASTSFGVAKESDAITSIDTVEIIDPSTISDATNRPTNLPYALCSYRITVNAVGAVAYVTIYYSEPIPEGMSFHKYDTITGWSDYSSHTTFNGDGRSVTLEVKDGGYGDTDGKANGVIVDPGGIGAGDSGISETGDSGVVSGGDSGAGGCFISSATSNSSEKIGGKSITTIDFLVPALALIAVFLSRGGKGGQNYRK